MFITRSIAAVLVLSATTAVLAQGKPDGLALADFEKLHKELQAPKDELWRSIPWQVSILDGRELAAKQQKPIFVWVASGEPLGCG